MRSSAWMAALVLCACGASSGRDAGPGDAAEATDAGSDAGVPDAGSPCGLLTLPVGTQISEGGRTRLELSFEGTPTDWSAQVAGTAFAIKEDATHLTLRAPNGGLGVSTVTVTVRCGADQGTARFDVEARRPSWAPLSQWTEGTNGPNNREYGVMWLDATNPDRLLLYGGFQYKPKQFTASSDLWEFDLGAASWKQLTPANASPEFMGGRVAPIPGKREIVFVGGVTAAFDVVTHLDRLAYAPDQLTWSPVTATAAPAVGDYQPGFVLDTRRGSYLSFCGQAADFHCNVRRLELDAQGHGTWSNVTVAGAVPPGRSGHFFAYDEETDRVILFGGMNAGGMLGDTWALEVGETPARWVKLGDNPELKRRNGAFVLDAQNHRFIIWGGTPDGAAASIGVQQLSLDRGAEVWVPMELTGAAPAPRASGMAVADPSRHRLVMGFGNSSVGNYADLWSINF